jgi:hypothetical protein
MSPDPKSRIESKFNELFGDQFAVEVTCLPHPLGRRGYRTQLIVDDLVVTEVFAGDRSKSYAKLAIAVEKLYAAGLALV